MTNEIKVGERYLTASGLPVRVVEISTSAVILQSLVSDNQISASRSYPLCRFKKQPQAFEMRPEPYGRRPKEAAIGSQPNAVQPLAPFIDAMLLAGNMTMRGIVRELRRKASASCKGRDLAANVRARLYWFRRKGYRMEKTGQDLRVVPPAEAASQ